MSVKCKLQFFFTKVATNRISQVPQKVIGHFQTVFIPSHNIMEGVIVLHETLHEMHRKKQSGVILKIDFEKAYDKLNWNFIQQTLNEGLFTHLVQMGTFLHGGGHVGVKVNDQVGQNIQTRKRSDKVIHYHPSFSTLYLTCWQS
jgi:hypothetical protein